MKVLIDMNLSPDWVEVFTRSGLSAIHWSSIGDPRAIDQTVMDWARDNSYVVFTHDLDFGTMLALTQAESPERDSGTHPRRIARSLGRDCHSGIA